MKCPAFFGVFLIGSIAIPCAAFGQSQPVQQVPQPHASADIPGKLPVPSGQFGIGRVAYDWMDLSRPDRTSDDPKAHRELMVYIWYPTSQNSAKIKGVYLPGAHEMNKEPEIQSRLEDEFGSSWPFILNGSIFSHSADVAPPVKIPKTLPVVLLSHGAGGSSFEYTSLIENLVSYGYVVAAIEHPGTAIAVVFSDGRIAPYHAENPPAGLAPAERFKWMGASISMGINEGAADVRFVFNRLTELNADPSQHLPLAARLDLNRVAAMGHSAGAEFAARACQLDARFKACVDLDGGMVPVAALPEYPDGETMKQPLLFLEAFHPESGMGGTHEQHEEYFKKKEAQLQACRSGSYDVVLNPPGMTHGSFSDYRLLAAGGDASGAKIALHNLDLAEEYVREFLDKNLKGAKAPLLDDGNAPHPEATIQVYGH